MHDPAFSTPRTDLIAEGVAVSPTVEVLKGLAADGLPNRLRVFFGYAGWSSGQLEGELKAGAWAVIDADPDLAFAPDPADVWDRARSLIKLDL